MTSALKTMTKLATFRSRRADMLVDHNADHRGRRPSGDVRLELAYFDRAFNNRF